MLLRQQLSRVRPANLSHVDLTDVYHLAFPSLVMMPSDLSENYDKIYVAVEVWLVGSAGTDVIVAGVLIVALLLFRTKFDSRTDSAILRVRSNPLAALSNVTFSRLSSVYQSGFRDSGFDCSLCPRRCHNIPHNQRLQ